MYTFERFLILQFTDRFGVYLMYGMIYVVDSIGISANSLQVYILNGTILQFLQELELPQLPSNLDWNIFYEQKFIAIPTQYLQ